jgi:cytosine/adenosine deaminase-related metal-dependent hydrolase
VNWSPKSPALYFENARLVEGNLGETRGTLRIARGQIVGINVPAQRGDIRFELDGAFVLPGLLNAHDHLELNNFPRWKNRDSYANAREWAMEANARLNSDIELVRARNVPLADRLFIGGLKNLLSGATTVAHHNPYHAPLRKNFPVRVVKRYGWSHSLYLSPDFANAYQRTPRAVPYMIHLAEGTDGAAQGEFEQIEKAGALHDNTIFIHGVGLTQAQRMRAIVQHTALVWCPSSNFFLLNETARVREFSDAHLLAIGSDSRLTGERDLLDELRAARETNQISADALLRAVTSDAAKILRVRDVGKIERGMRADLIILPKGVRSTADALGKISRADLRAVVLNGALQFADADFAVLMKNAERVRLDGREKIVTRALARRYARNSIREAGLEMEGAASAAETI